MGRGTNLTVEGIDLAPSFKDDFLSLWEIDRHSVVMLDYLKRVGPRGREKDGSRDGIASGAFPRQSVTWRICILKASTDESWEFVRQGGHQKNLGGCDSEVKVSQLVRQSGQAGWRGRGVVFALSRCESPKDAMLVDSR